MGLHIGVIIMSKKNPTEDEVGTQAGQVKDDDLFSVDVNVEDPAFGASYPILQWINGDVKNKKAGGIEHTGGFFIAAEQGVENIPGAEKHTFITKSGTEIEGYAVRDLTITPIRYRRSWLARPDENDVFTRFPWNAYEDAKEFDGKGSPRGRGQLLCLIEGMDEPVVLTMSGFSAAALLSSGKDRGAIPAYAQIIVNRARQLAKKAGRDIDYPLCAFKMKIGPGRNEKGEPVFTEVGTGDDTSNITKPSWLDKPEGVPDETHVKRLFVGRDLFGKTQDIHRQADDWVKAWTAEELVKGLKRTASTKNAMRQATSELKGEGTGMPTGEENPF